VLITRYYDIFLIYLADNLLSNEEHDTQVGLDDWEMGVRFPVLENHSYLLHNIQARPYSYSVDI
jgi:hypothetical protein